MSEHAAKKRNLGDGSVAKRALDALQSKMIAAHDLPNAPVGAYRMRADCDYHYLVMDVVGFDRSVHELRFEYDLEQDRILLAFDDLYLAVKTLRTLGAGIGVKHAAASSSAAVRALFQDLREMLLSTKLARAEADRNLALHEVTSSSGDFRSLCCAAAASCEELLRLEACAEAAKVAIEHWLASRKLELQARLEASAAAMADLQNAVAGEFEADVGALVNAAHAAFKLEKDACMKATPAELAKYLLDRASTHKLTLEPQE